MSERKVRIGQLTEELARLQTEETADVRKTHAKLVAQVTHGMNYDELCAFREALNDRIREQYASDAIDDE